MGDESVGRLKEADNPQHAMDRVGEELNAITRSESIWQWCCFRGVPELNRFSPDEQTRLIHAWLVTRPGRKWCYKVLAWLGKTTVCLMLLSLLMAGAVWLAELFELWGLLKAIEAIIPHEDAPLWLVIFAVTIELAMAWIVIVIVRGLMWFVAIRPGFRGFVREQIPGGRGACSSCGYNLRGSTSRECPECGNPIKAVAPPSSP